MSEQLQPTSQTFYFGGTRTPESADPKGTITITYEQLQQEKEDAYFEGICDIAYNCGGIPRRGRSKEEMLPIQIGMSIERASHLKNKDAAWRVELDAWYDKTDDVKEERRKFNNEVSQERNAKLLELLKGFQISADSKKESENAEG